MSKQQPNQFPHSIGLAPQQAQGCRVVPVTVSFAGAVNTIQTYTDDFFIEEQDGTINAIQSMYFDNSRNFVPMFVTVNETGQNITVPPQSQGFVPIFALTGMSYTVNFMGTEAGQQGNAVLKMMFYNTPCQPFIWKPYSDGPGYFVNQSNSTGAALSAVTNNNSNVFPNRRIYIDGFDVSAAGTAITATFVAVSLSGILTGAGGQGGNMGWNVNCVASGFYFEKKFSPSLMSAFGSAITNGGYQSSNVTLSSAAVAGATNMEMNLYWHLD